MRLSFLSILVFVVYISTAHGLFSSGGSSVTSWILGGDNDEDSEDHHSSSSGNNEGEENVDEVTEGESEDHTWDNEDNHHQDPSSDSEDHEWDNEDRHSSVSEDHSLDRNHNHTSSSDDNDHNHSKSPHGWNKWNSWKDWDLTENVLNLLTNKTACSDDHLLQCSGRVATIYGDPHISTFDGVGTTCQAEGEFVLVNAKGNIQIQTRFEKLTSSAVSVTTGIAVQVAGIDLIQVSLAEYSSGLGFSICRDGGCDLHLYVNGVLQTPNAITGHGYSITISRSSIDIQFFDASDGITPTYAISIQVTSIRGGACMLTAYFCLPTSLPEVLDSVVGLLGTPNCDDTDEWMTSLGELLPFSNDSHDEYDYCTANHCILSEAKSLFCHEEGHGGKSFLDILNCAAEFQGEIDISNPDPEVLDICGSDNKECILDGLVSGVQGAISTACAQDNIVAMHISNTVVDLLTPWDHHNHSSSDSEDHHASSSDNADNHASSSDSNDHDDSSSDSDDHHHHSKNHHGWNKWNSWKDWDLTENTLNLLKNKTACSDDHLLQCSGRVATIYGDPHISTFDGVGTTCQAEGEFVLVNAEGNIQIQTRFEKLTSSAVSVTTGIAVQVAGIDLIQVSLAEYSSGLGFSICRDGGCDLHLYVNGVLQTPNAITGHGYSITISRSSIDIQFFDASDGITPTYAISIQVTSIRGGACMLTAYFCLPTSLPEVLDSVVGLLGTPNCDDTDEWMTSLGELLPFSNDSHDEYDYCTANHCILSEAKSLFCHEEGHGGKSFLDILNCAAEFQGEIDISDPDPEVLDICGNDDKECILDGLVTGVQGAISTAGVQDNIVAIHISNTIVDLEPDNSCPGDITLLHTTGVAEFDQVPLTIVEQNIDSVTLKLRATLFSGLASLYVQYSHDFHDFCLSQRDVSASFFEEFTVSCPSSGNVAIVNVFAADVSLDLFGDIAQLPHCCHADDDTNPKVQYSFMVSCVSQCEKDTTARRLRGSR